MSSSSVPPSLQEIWDSNRRADEETRGMSREALIRYYHDKADQAEQRLGIKLKARPASQAKGSSSTAT